VADAIARPFATDASSSLATPDVTVHAPQTGVKASSSAAAYEPYSRLTIADAGHSPCSSRRIACARRFLACEPNKPERRSTRIPAITRIERRDSRFHRAPDRAE
jgi:hypothetical protein